MAQPTRFTPSYDFTSFQILNPGQVPGDQLDTQFALVKGTFDETLANLALIQRDDGRLANGSVGLDQLDASFSLGVNPPNAWATATAYTVNSLVFNGNRLYRCLVAHTSGVFATDLAAAKWLLLCDLQNGVSTILSGAGAPSPGTGVDGDFYVDTTVPAIYGPKTSGAWGSATPLIGFNGLSIAGLRTFTVVVDVVRLKGYYAGSAKGGGSFWYDSSDTTTADDGFLAIVDSLNRRWKRIIGPEGVDAYMAGAKGDGAIDNSGVVTGTDDTAAINKLFDYVRSSKNINADVAPVAVSIGPGVFRCDGSINAANITNVRWELDGRGTTIASRAAGKPAFDLSNSDGTFINRLTVHGDPTARPAVGYFPCRIGPTADDMSFTRPKTIGEFLYAGFLNSGGENVYLEQPKFENNYKGTCYGMALDSKTFLRYDPPVTPSGFSTANPMVITKTSHGLVNGDRVYITGTVGTSGVNGRRWTVTRIDADTFSIPVSGTGYASGGKYFKARFWSDFIADVDDTIEPYVGDGAFTVIVNGGQANAPYGKAGIFDTPGGRRRINMRSTCAIYDDPNTSNKAITSITTGTNVIVATAHGLSVNDVVWVTGTGNATNDNQIFRVGVVTNVNTITVTRLDTTATTTATTGAVGTLRKQVTSGGYAVHWMLDESGFETPRYENIHHEPGNGSDLRKINAMAYIQDIEPLRTGGSAGAVRVNGGRFAEHTWRGVYGGFIIDTATVASMLWTGSIYAGDFSSDFGNGNKVGKLFGGNAALWTVSGDLFLDDATVLSSTTNLNGRLVNSTDGSVTWRLGPSSASAKTANYTVLASESGTAFTNDNAVAQVDFTLPAAVAGLNYEFTCLAAQIIRALVVPAGDDTITLGTTTGTAQIISTATLYTSIRLKCYNARRWIVIGGNNTGAWTPS